MKKILQKRIIVFVCIVLATMLLFGCKTKPEGSVSLNDLKWWQKTLVYEAYPSSFKDSDGDGYGDINGLRSKLDYLKSLGVGAIWLTPVYASPMGDNGYDVADYYSINPLYGTMEDMDNLIKEANDRNIKIVMDLVFNHTSKEHSWFKESSKSKDNEKSDWYIWKDPLPDGSAPNNWRGIFGGSAWTYDENRKQYYLHTFADFQPDVNWENEDLRNALYDVANFWVDKGVGGFRVDAVTYIKKPSDFTCDEVDGADNMMDIHKKTANTKGILDFLKEFNKKIETDRDIFLVGEANGVPLNEMNDWVGKNGIFDMIFSFDLCNMPFTDGEYWYNTKKFSIKDLKKVLSDMVKSTNNTGWLPIFFENHDQSRSVEHFLLECEDKENGAKALATLLMTLKGTPFLYEGEEIGMTNLDRKSISDYQDVKAKGQYKQALENGLDEKEALECVKRFSRENARSPMQWDASKNAGFTTGTPWLALNENYVKVNVENEEKSNSSVLNYYKRLNEERNKHSALIAGSYKEILEDDEKIYAYEREDEKEKVIIIVNLSNTNTMYDNDIVKGAKLDFSSYDRENIGFLKPYEAVCYSISK